MTNVNAFRTGDSDGIVRDPYKMYIGVGGVPKDIVSIYVGTPGGVQQCWDNEIPKPAIDADYNTATLTFTDTSKRANGYRLFVAEDLTDWYSPDTIPKRNIYDMTMVPGSTVTVNLITIQNRDDMRMDKERRIWAAVFLRDTTGYFEDSDVSNQVACPISIYNGHRTFNETLSKPGTELNLFGMGSYKIRGENTELFNFTVNDEGVWYGRTKAYDFATNTWFKSRNIEIIDDWYIPQLLGGWLSKNAEWGWS